MNYFWKSIDISSSIFITFLTSGSEDANCKGRAMVETFF